MNIQIVIKVIDGEGDHGSGYRCVFDNRSSIADGRRLAQFFADHFQAEATLFKGKMLGKFVQSFLPHNSTNTNKT